MWAYHHKVAVPDPNTPVNRCDWLSAPSWAFGFGTIGALLYREELLPRNHDPEHRNDDPETGNHDPEPRNDDPESRNEDQEPGNKDQAPGNDDPEPGNDDPEARNGEGGRGEREGGEINQLFLVQRTQQPHHQLPRGA